MQLQDMGLTINTLAAIIHAIFIEFKLQRKDKSKNKTTTVMTGANSLPMLILVIMVKPMHLRGTCYNTREIHTLSIIIVLLNFSL